MELVTISIFFIVLALSYWALTQKKRGLPPGPTGWPIINNYGYIHNMADMYKGLTILKQRYGDIFYLRFMFTDVIVLNSPDVIREILVKNAEDFSERPYLFVGKQGRDNKGVIHNHESWKETRRFSLVALRDFGLGKKSLEEKIHEEVQFLSKALDATNGEPCSIDVLMNKSVSNIICSIVFGKRFEYDDKEFEDLLSGLSYIFQTFGGPYSSLNFNVFLQAALVVMVKILPFQPTKTMVIFEELKKFIHKRIKEHKETFDPSDIRDLIDLYIEAEAAQGQSKVSVEDCYAIIVDLFAAGTETTSTTLKWFMLYMMHEPEVQQKCYEEISKNIGTSVQITMKDRGKCPYFEATLLEVQRICTTVPLSLPHTVERDLIFNGHFFPKGAVVVPNLYAAHHDAAYWGDPEVFRPERWLDTEGKIINHSAFMHFSLGRRACLGEQLAKMELFFYASSLIQGFRFTMVDPKNPPCKEGVQGITLLPKPYELKIMARSCAL